MKKIVTLSIVASSVIVAQGYRIPEQSLNSMALSAAYVAHTTGADTAYYNPANMSFMDAGKSYVEGGITLAHLPANVYTLMDPFSGESEAEDILIPFLHYVSKPIGDFRWGVSMTAPGGLTKRWETPYQKLYAEEFTLKIVELNPSLSYRVTDDFSIGGGLRLIYSEGVIKSDGGSIAPIKREMEGDTVEFGYNLAMTYKPTSDINFAVTYRSNIDLQEEGQANLYFGGVGQQYDAEVTVPLPAALNIAISKTWQEKFTLEFNYERTYWSTYETLDFNYDRPIQAGLMPVFDDPIAKNWKDTNTFRIGATMEMDKITMMMGFAIDETAVPVETLGFELPDSDAKIFSMGFRYQQTDNLSWGAAFLYDSKESISLVPGAHDDENSLLNSGGSFHEGGAFLTTVGLSYEY
ncbi:MAG: long-chain fatty acid transporter [Sulfurovum sp.]|nr:MAG: long-chain fatty acid transporter [Sulfurovum sp.]